MGKFVRIGGKAYYVDAQRDGIEITLDADAVTYDPDLDTNTVKIPRDLVEVIVSVYGD